MYRLTIKYPFSGTKEYRDLNVDGLVALLNDIGHHPPPFEIGLE